MGIRRGKFFIVFIALSIWLNACSPTSAQDPAKSGETALTQAAATVIAKLTPLPQTLAARVTATPTLRPNVTATATLIPSQTATFTLAPLGPIPVIHIKVFAYCREGPGSQYQVVSLLAAGDTMSLLGKSQDGQWLYTLTPKTQRRIPANNCWVYYGSTSITGDATAVSVVAAPFGPTSTPTPGASIAISVTSNPTTYTGNCPTSLLFTAQVTSNSALTLAYQWEKSDGTVTHQSVLVFNGPGTQSVSYSWQVSTSGSRSLKMHVVSPLDEVSAPVAVPVACNP